jgi:hypothetical protein
MVCRDTQISCIAAKSLAEPPEVCRPQDGLKSEAPKHPEILGRAIRRTPHKEAFISDVKSWGCLSSWRRHEGDDGVVGRSSDLESTMTKLEEGLAT